MCGKHVRGGEDACISQMANVDKEHDERGVSDTHYRELKDNMRRYKAKKMEGCQ